MGAFGVAFHIIITSIETLWKLSNELLHFFTSESSENQPPLLQKKQMAKLENHTYLCEISKVNLTLNPIHITLHRGWKGIFNSFSKTIF